MNDGTIVLKCDCKDEQQDRLYGSGLRLHNKAYAKGKEVGTAYCTVCSPSRRRNKLIADVLPNPAMNIKYATSGYKGSKGKSYTVKK